MQAAEALLLKSMPSGRHISLRVRAAFPAAERLLFCIRARLRKLRKTSTRVPKGRLKMNQTANNTVFERFSRPFGTGSLGTVTQDCVLG